MAYVTYNGIPNDDRISYDDTDYGIADLLDREGVAALAVYDRYDLSTARSYHSFRCYVAPSLNGKRYRK